jgi:hypothetical protein
VGDLYHFGAEPSRSFSDDTAERLRRSTNSKQSHGGALAATLSGCAVPDSGAPAEPWRSVSETNSGPTAKSNYC